MALKEEPAEPPTPQEWAAVKDKAEKAHAAARAAEARATIMDESFRTVWSRLKELEEGGTTPAAAEDAEEEEEEEEEPPRDWLNVPDVEAARLWLKELQEWIESTWQWMPKAVILPPCWPWHHTVVQELLAISEHRKAAYTVGGAQVSDLLTRWWPEALARIGAELSGKCSAGAGPIHREGDRSWEVDPGQASHLAAWWVESRDPADRPGLTLLQ